MAQHASVAFTTVSPVKLAGPGNLRTRPRSSISPVWGRLMLAKACTQSNSCCTMLQQLYCKLGSLRIAKQYQGACCAAHCGRLTDMRLT